MLLPIGDYLRTRKPAYVNWAIIAANVAVFLYMTLYLNNSHLAEVIGRTRLGEVDKFFYDWGFVPSCVGKALGLGTNGADPRVIQAVCHSTDRTLIQVLTAMFVHDGWIHILGNMLFLWIFGDNVEDAMGHFRYLVFYLVCGIVAAGTQTYMSLDSTGPAVGASGAIAGVLGAYLVMYPKAVVQVILFPLFFIPFFVPAVVLIGVWFLMQLVSGLASVGTAAAGPGVAWWAHVGGFIAGMVLIWLFRQRRRAATRVLGPGS